MINATVISKEYVIKKVVRRGYSANIRFLEKEIGKKFSLIPLIDHMQMDIKKQNNEYKIRIYNINNIFTDEVKPIKSRKKITGGYIGIDSKYLGINVLVIPYD